MFEPSPRPATLSPRLDRSANGAGCSALLLGLALGLGSFGAARPAGAAPVGAAPPLPFRGRMEVRHWFVRHTTGHRSASGRGRSGAVELVLQPGGRALATDQGERKAWHSAASWGYSGERVTWSNRWQGQWSIRRGRLRLRLRRSQRTCTRVKSTSHASDTAQRKQTLPCARAPKALALECEATTVRLPPAHPRPPRPASGARVWQCLPVAGPGETGGSETPWTFGWTTCLEQSGHGRIRYGRCPPKAPAPRPSPPAPRP